ALCAAHAWSLVRQVLMAASACCVTVVPFQVHASGKPVSKIRAALWRSHSLTPPRRHRWRQLTQQTQHAVQRWYRAIPASLRSSTSTPCQPEWKSWATAQVAWSLLTGSRALIWQPLLSPAAWIHTLSLAHWRHWWRIPPPRTRKGFREVLMTVPASVFPPMG